MKSNKNREKNSDHDEMKHEKHHDKKEHIKSNGKAHQSFSV